MMLLKLLLIERLLKTELLGQGFSESQAQDIIENEVTRARLVAWLKKWGPKILEILLMVLPLVLSNTRHIPLGRRSTTVVQINDLTLPTAQEIWNTHE